MSEDFSTAISPIEEIIEDARNGKMYVLVDAEDRENEGDLIIPAQFATPDQVNFMAKFGRGLICLSMNRERARGLDLDMMARENRESMQTAFTVSIEAKEGVTTGISAHDRSHTIAVAIDPTKGPADIVSPGHVFPLVARDGGVLVRAGHTEAAVDISRLAGLYPAGVICEIMNDDGSMARLPELVSFAQLHGLKVGTIADLIAYRRREDRFLERKIETDFQSAYGGEFKLIVFKNTIDDTEHVALVKGRISGDEPTLVRVHRVDFLTDVLGQAGGREDMVKKAIKTLGDSDESGVAVFVRMGTKADLVTRLGGVDDGKPDPSAPLREYGIGAQILKDLGVRKMILISNHGPSSLPGLDGYGLSVEGWRKFSGDE
ncbi:3,4-dihydroxy-2-butanone-4-phosphate synthase [Hirschia baltica]|uniref:3,4-dihydroxy-2-butanone 4-phosphate synthase n=1 Tax=Hirschia baltica (strain ATCC 49814 / DSM 5838 / IFAM 1418) TaxID=582402 RepID=C6XIX3_HIRBI|nr:3,4-dihydroxy-2-butanone-4-phosphate synthase [Hirschia baltica]ACT59068.1 3,4-dihydroxy-2-butanone 4-phosphate synthase [Hirschia baltica ATCC 49814]